MTFFPEKISIDKWIAENSILFSPDNDESINYAMDRVFLLIDRKVKLLGMGEALHGGEDLIILRNKLFQCLVEKHGFAAIAVESSYPRGLIINDYVCGRTNSLYDEIKDKGFSHGFGNLEANRELVEWIREYNSSKPDDKKIRFYGFDAPCEMTATDSPGHVLRFAIDYLGSIDSIAARKRRISIEKLIGSDADWENPVAMMDPSKSVGLSSNASALRIETEDLITELEIRRPELITAAGADRYWEALQHAYIARQLLNYHAGLARNTETRISDLLGIRDLMMADIVRYIVSREEERGKVFLFAHNSHLKCGITEWQLGTNLLKWWPAGAHLKEIFREGYAVIGSGLGVSEENGIGAPEDGTLEALLTSNPEDGRFIPTYKGKIISEDEINNLPVRMGSMKNMSYFPFTKNSFTDFDWLVFLNNSRYTRGGPEIQ